MVVFKVLADSSSIILLQKAGLLDIFLQNYQILITSHVYCELTAGGQKGSNELDALLAESIVQSSADNCLAGMGQGESSILRLYLSGVGDFVLLDDKKGAKYCRSHEIPFINALLVPRILFLAGLINEKDYSSTAELLVQEGYYSTIIIEKAATIRDVELQQFITL